MTRTATKTTAKQPAVAPRAVERSPAAAPRKRAAAATKVAQAPVVADVKAAGKLVRDSFTMPRQDFDLIPALKKRALAFQRPTKKSELLRAGLQALAALDDKRLKAALDALVAIKAGRPKKTG
ncbi:MAG: hypothetical protein IV105_01595 [Rhizobacter sp.]|nr:hypothetical protein [Rhizobacter sp.]